MTLEDLYSFDLILTMDKDNLAVMNSMADDAGAELKATIEPILNYSKIANSLDVPDPYYGGNDGFEEVLDLLEDACQGLLDTLTSQD